MIVVGRGVMTKVLTPFSTSISQRTKLNLQIDLEARNGEAKKELFHPQPHFIVILNLPVGRMTCSLLSS